MAAAPVPAPLPQRPRPGQVSSPGPAAPWAHLQAPRRPPLGRAAGSEGGAGGLRSPDEPRPPAARPRGEGRGRGAGGRRGDAAGLGRESADGTCCQVFTFRWSRHLRPGRRGRNAPERICLRRGFPESRLGPAVVFPYFLTGPWFPKREAFVQRRNLT